MTHSDTTGHLLTLADMDRATLSSLLDQAEHYILQTGKPAPRNNHLAGFTVANLFYEPSTRTRASFELAAKRLGADVLNLDVDTSSAVKGETVLDTVDTLLAMGVNAFVVRHRDEGVLELLANHIGARAVVINAGEGTSNHPTQGLLDMLTIRQHKPDFAELTVTIIGDIKHSRVARSDVQALHTLGVKALRFAGPDNLLPTDIENWPGERNADIDAALKGADVLMLLRIQKERLVDTSLPFDDYFKAFGISPARLALAAPDAIVLHPGPMNRGVEIDDAVADGPQSVIRKQVANGVAVRMAVLETLLKKPQAIKRQD